jgi:CcmD family protein
MDQRNFTFMFYGFAAAWLIIVVYVITLVARERRIRQEMDRLRRMVESGGA